MTSRVSDAETGLPLAGALVELTGANSATALSAADGTYGFVDLVPGAAELQVSLAGYLAVSASGEVAAGSRLVFDPSLTPEGAVPVGNGGMSGRVIGADSGNPLLGVAVSATGSGPTAEPIFLVSGVDGRFDFTALPADAYTLSFEQSDRVSRSFSVLVTSGAVTDVGTIALSRAVDGVSIFGQVSDFNTGDPIPRAVVSALGSTLSSLADEAGRFRLDGLETGASTLYFSATGYASQTFLGRFEQNGEFEVNRALTRSTASGLQIEFLASDQPVYGAFDPAVFQANVRNNGNPLQAAVNLSVFDANDRLVTVLEATSTDTGSNRIDLPTGATVATTASMNTADLAPGDQTTLGYEALVDGVLVAGQAGEVTADLAPGRYRVLARVEVGDQLVGPATAILAERTMEFDIEPERTLAGLELNFATPFSAVGSTTPLELIASLSNRSNVPYQLQFNFSLRDEQNQSVFLSPLINVSVTPEQDTLLIPIDPITPTLQRSGEHRLVVSIFSQPRGPITAGILSVAPALRIDPSQSLQPSLVTPDENKRIRVNIRLQGREVQ